MTTVAHAMVEIFYWGAKHNALTCKYRTFHGYARNGVYYVSWRDAGEEGLSAEHSDFEEASKRLLGALILEVKDISGEEAA